MGGFPGPGDTEVADPYVLRGLTWGGAGGASNSQIISEGIGEFLNVRIPSPPLGVMPVIGVADQVLLNQQGQAITCDSALPIWAAGSPSSNNKSMFEDVTICPATDGYTPAAEDCVLMLNGGIVGGAQQGNAKAKGFTVCSFDINGNQERAAGLGWFGPRSLMSEMQAIGGSQYSYYDFGGGTGHGDQTANQSRMLNCHAYADSAGLGSLYINSNDFGFVYFNAHGAVTVDVQAGGNVLFGGHVVGSNWPYCFTLNAPCFLSHMYLDGCFGGAPGASALVLINASGNFPVLLADCTFYQNGKAITGVQPCDLIDIIIAAATTVGLMVDGGTIGVTTASGWAANTYWNTPMINVSGSPSHLNYVFKDVLSMTQINTPWYPSTAPPNDYAWDYPPSGGGTPQHHTPRIDTGPQELTDTLTAAQVGVSGVLGAYIAMSMPVVPATNYYLSFGTYKPNGVSTETINFSIKVTYNDGTTTTATISNVTGNMATQPMNNSTLTTLVTTGKFITGFSVACSTSAAATNATPAVTLVLTPDH